MQFFVGTSGFSYKEWKGVFYPATLKAKDMLGYYAERFSTVEINNSFYRLPKAEAVEGWASQVPAGFQFVLKAPQTITHFRRLKDVAEPVDQFLKVAAQLKKTRGPLLFQLPPNMKKDVERLDAFLAKIGKKAAVAMEFRHESWFDQEVYDCLKQRNCPLCHADGEEIPGAEFVSTADWGYVRLRRVAYKKSDLARWVRRIREQRWKKAYVFFKHEDAGTGPKLAETFLKLVAAA